MRGVVIKKALVIAEDERRKITSILNGQLGIRDIHILHMKEGPLDNNGLVDLPLGNHHHFYPELMYVLKGKAHYWLKNKEGETEEVDMEEGDIMFRASGVIHTAKCSPDCILIDACSESWISEEWNHVREELI